MVKEAMGALDPRNPLEMAASIGSKPQELNREWSSLSSLDFSSWIVSMGEKLGFSWQEWSQMLVQSGVSIERTIDLQLRKLQESKVEQDTAIKLRQDFGQPQAPIPMILEVYAELAAMEADAREKLQSQASLVENWWRLFQRKITEMIALSLAVELEKIETEEKSYEESLVKARGMGDARQVLTDSITYVENTVRSKKTELTTRKNELLESLRRLGYGLLGNVQNAFETTVFQASRQAMTLTAIN